MILRVREFMTNHVKSLLQIDAPVFRVEWRSHFWPHRSYRVEDEPLQHDVGNNGARTHPSERLAGTN
jgi:hypothetical protein